MAGCQGARDLGYPYGKAAGDTPGVGGDPYPFGECTWFIWRYYRDQGVSLPGGLGDAHEWLDAARKLGWGTYDRPQGNTVAVWGTGDYPPFGHVAVVTSVAADGTFVVREANFCYSVQTNPGRVDERTVAAGDPQPMGFALPAGAGLGAGAATNSVPDLLAPLAGVSNAIRWVGLEAEAAALTAAAKMTAGGQMAMGGLVMGAGAGLFVLGARGVTPSGAVRRVRRRARRAVPAIRQQFPESVPQPEILPPASPAGVRPGRTARVPAARLTRTLPPAP